jgi:membrane-associated phospholipid phosphatase
MTGADLLPPACLVMVGIATGLVWRLPAFGRLDSFLMHKINTDSLPSAVDQVLGLLRIAGTTPFFVAVLVLVGLARPGYALGLALAAGAAEVITKILKMAVRRPRPFASDAGVVVRLPRLPVDPSFPSGDAMRAAFLGGLTLAGKGLPAWGACVAVLAAVVVGFGRVRSGVHYPLDVWTGLAVGFGAVLAWAGTLGM